MTNTEMTTQKFEKLLVAFLFDEPFFSSIIRAMKKVKTETIVPTAGVAVIDGSICLYWNPDFVEKLTKRQFFGLMKHECYHLIFDHVTSRKQDPHLLWNIATDLAINSIIPKDELPDGGLIPGQPLQSQANLQDEKTNEKAAMLSKVIENLPRNKTSEWYMEKLKEDPDVAEAMEDVFGDDGAGFDVHFDMDSTGMSESDKELMKGKLKEIIKKSADRAFQNNSWGSVSSEVRSQIMTSVQDTVDWKKTLHYFCGNKQKANKSKTYRRINRKYPYIHPGTKTKRTSNLAIYIDQSGSVGDDGISSFFGTLNKLARNVSFKVFHFDTVVDKDSEYAWRKGKKYKLPMRTLSGGTCFDCVEDHFRKRSSEFDGYIVMTDGCAPKPKSCISKRCWVLLPGYELSFPVEKRDSVVKMEM